MKKLAVGLLLAAIATTSMAGPISGNQGYRKPTKTECSTWFFKSWIQYTNHCTNGKGLVKYQKNIKT